MSERVLYVYAEVSVTELTEPHQEGIGMIQQIFQVWPSCATNSDGN